jgi:hypothetical protein
MKLTHLQAMVLFAIVVSVAFAVMSKRTVRERLVYVGWSVFWFLAIAIGVGWLMYAFAR